MIKYDVVIVSDFRLPGGTNRSTAEELRIHRSNNIRTGLIHASSKLAQKPAQWADCIQSELCPQRVTPVLRGVPAHAKLMLLRHPTAAAAVPDTKGYLTVEHAVIVANQPAVRPDGSEEYSPRQITAEVEHRVGVKPVWAPISPQVRRTLTNTLSPDELLPVDWNNVFAESNASPPRADFNRDRIRIGRHSRPSPDKWPSCAGDILSAYPASSEFKVQILGGAGPAIDLIGETPPNWEIHPFGSKEPEDFLRDVDFWVYFHHPNWMEAYGRSIMEALRAGCVAILPHYFEETFGDAAVYCSPSEVKRMINSFVDGTYSYAKQSARARTFAVKHCTAEAHLSRLQTFLAHATSESASPQRSKVMSEIVLPRRRLDTRHVPPTQRLANTQPPRTLVVTSNGAGMGHLTRMLGLARELSSFADPIFLSMSQGVDVVSSAGFSYEYIPFNSSVQTKSNLWHDYARDRFLTAIDNYQARILIFDGTWPYRGLMEAVKKRDLLLVWVRRGMWKPTITPEQLQKAPEFDLVIEPGDYAAEYDTGATSLMTASHRVPPMVSLRSDEVVSRDHAMQALGLDPHRRYALVTLGAGNINDTGSVQRTAVEAIRALRGYTPVITSAPIAEASHADTGGITLRTYPLATFLNAFDFSVSASGYNSFNEFMAFSLPTLWVPNLYTMTDDQDARARWAADKDYGLRTVGNDRDEINTAIMEMADESNRHRFLNNLDKLPSAVGTQHAAQLVHRAWKQFENSRGGR